MLKPTRVIFNYAARCNMPCGFCYVPFNGQKTTLAEKQAYIDRLSRLGTELVTFGGGDPLMDREFPTLVRHTTAHGLKIQLDTNGLCLSEDHLPLLRDHVSFMSLPLEGDAQANALMRGNEKHFGHVLKWLPRLLDAGIKVKINTVASLKNIDALPALGKILLPFAERAENPLARWSIYEFIPAESGELNRAAFELAPNQFNRAADELKSAFPTLPIEAGARGNRKSAYFFMNDNGMVYISDPSPSRDSAVFIGHILDRNIDKTWSNLIESRDHGQSFKSRADLRLTLVHQK